jgi:hypothetical protein
MSTADDPERENLEETPAEAAAEERQTVLDAREAVGAELGDDGDSEIAEEEGIS